MKNMKSGDRVVFKHPVTGRLEGSLVKTVTPEHAEHPKNAVWLIRLDNGQEMQMHDGALELLSETGAPAAPAAKHFLVGKRGNIALREGLWFPVTGRCTAILTTVLAVEDGFLLVEDEPGGPQHIIPLSNVLGMTDTNNATKES
jgi:hypothetical protein